MARAILSHDPELGSTLTMPVRYGLEPESLRIALTTLGWYWKPDWHQWRRAETAGTPADTTRLETSRTVVAALTGWDVDVDAANTVPTGHLLDPAAVDIAPGDWVRSQRTGVLDGFVRIDLFGVTPRTDAGDQWRQVAEVLTDPEPTVILTDPYHLDADGAPATLAVPTAFLSGHHPTH